VGQLGEEVVADGGNETWLKAKSFKTKQLVEI